MRLRGAERDRLGHPTDQDRAQHSRDITGASNGAAAVHCVERMFSGTANVQTFAVPELCATKIRALYQRKKGQDLFDLWLALTELGIPGSDIVGAFTPYRPEGITPASSEANLRAKLDDPGFRTDLETLVTEWPTGYDIEQAAELVIADVLSQI